MKVVVTGSSGFIGPHVIEALKKAAHQVIAFDLKAPSTNCEFVQGDLANLDALVNVTRAVDGLCHLGGVGDVYLAFDKPYIAAAANVTGTANVMEACLRNGVRKVVYASTWEVYGKPRYNPIDENHPCAPDHPYNITKLAGERVVLAYDKLKGVPAIGLRLGTAYGMGMRSNSVFSIFVGLAKDGRPLTIKGSGSQCRQFTHVRDIARAFVMAIESPIHGEVLNIVAPESISIKQLAELIMERLPTTVTYEPGRVGDVPFAPVSSQKAKEVLGWEPRMSFRDGLLELIQSSL